MVWTQFSLYCLIRRFCFPGIRCVPSPLVNTHKIMYGIQILQKVHHVTNGAKATFIFTSQGPLQSRPILLFSVGQILFFTSVHPDFLNQTKKILCIIVGLCFKICSTSIFTINGHEIVPSCIMQRRGQHTLIYMAVFRSLGVKF